MVRALLMRSHMPVERTVYFYSSLSIYPSELLINGSPSSTNCQFFQIEVAWPPLWQHLSPSSKLQDVAQVKHRVSLISTRHRESLPECTTVSNVRRPAASLKTPASKLGLTFSTLPLSYQRPSLDRNHSLSQAWVWLGKRSVELLSYWESVVAWAIVSLSSFVPTLLDSIKLLRCVRYLSSNISSIFGRVIFRSKFTFCLIALILLGVLGLDHIANISARLDS